MKFILFNINDTNKDYINKITLDETTYINEVSLSSANLRKRQTNSMKNLKSKIYDYFLRRKIIKALEGYNKKWYYIISNKISDSKYIATKAQELLGYKLTCTNELDNNIFCYIDEYLKDNSKLNKESLSVLIVGNYNKSLNFKLIENLIKEFKKVNIHLKEKPSPYTLKRIGEINKAHGTTIDVLKKDKKDCTEYNVVYFVDDFASNYPRLRVNKQVLIIDERVKITDKFNSSLIFMNSYLKNNNTNKKILNEMLNDYNALELANVIKKTVN